MSAARTERRLRRLQSGIDRYEDRLKAMAELRARHQRAEMEAAELSIAHKERFLDNLSIAFREPHRAMKAWQRHEWSAWNLTLEERSPADVAERTYNAMTSRLRISGLQLRGRRILGKDDGEREAAMTALARLADNRQKWIEYVRESRMHGRAALETERWTAPLRARLHGARQRHRALLADLYRDRNEELAQDRKTIPIPEHLLPKEPQPTQTERLGPIMANADERRVASEQHYRLQSRMERLRRGIIATRSRYVDANPSDVDIDLHDPQKTKSAFEAATAKHAMLRQRLYAANLRYRELSAEARELIRRDPSFEPYSREDLDAMRELEQAYIEAIKREHDPRMRGMTEGQRNYVRFMEKREKRLNGYIEKYRTRLSVLNDWDYDFLHDPRRDGKDIPREKRGWEAMQARRKEVEAQSQSLRRRIHAATLIRDRLRQDLAMEPVRLPEQRIIDAHTNNRLLQMMRERQEAEQRAIEKEQDERAERARKRRRERERDSGRGR